MPPGNLPARGGHLPQTIDTTPTMLPAPACLASPSKPIAAAPAPRRLCLLGDNALLARDTAMRLRAAGYEVAVAAEVPELAALAEAHGASCILIDPSARASRYADPVCVARIRAHCATPLPIVWLAPVNSFEARLAAARAGVDGLLAKPVDLAALKDLIEALARRAAQPPYRVLVVGSDAQRAAGIDGALAGAGMDVLRLARPVDLLATLSREHPEALLLDVDTGACDGVDLAMLIRQDPAFLDLPVMVLARAPDAALRRRAVAAGVDDVLAMPAAADELALALAGRIERSRALRSLITRDGMTGLYNHVSIKEQAVREMARSRREGTPLALAMVDLDYFKNINDSYGHPVGDQVIRSIAQLLQQRLRHGDLVGRYGGEEFAVILPGTPAQAAAAVLDEIRALFGQIVHRADELAFSASFSAGVAGLEADGGAAEELFERADAALYQAKRGGRNRVAVAP